MSAYRLSPIRNKGWLRLGLAGAVAMIPYTAMEHAQGRFSEGPTGLQQAAEFLASGMAIWLIIGFAMAWVMHGFAVRAKSEDEEESGHRSSGLGGGGSHGAPPSHGGSTGGGGAHPPKAH